MGLKKWTPEGLYGSDSCLEFPQWRSLTGIAVCVKQMWRLIGVIVQCVSQGVTVGM